MPNEQPNHSVTNLAGQQAGDQQITAAGRDVRHGADADAVLGFLREYVFAADQQRETAIKAVAQQLARNRDDMGIVTDAVRSVRDRLNADDDARVRRQRELDHALATLGESLEAQDIALAELRRGQRIARRWIAALTLALAVALAVVAWLVWREAAALAARAAFDAVVAGRR